MKHTLVWLSICILATSCSALNSLNDMNCKLSEDRSKNFIGKWKAIGNHKKFIWRFYSDNTTATLENEYLTQVFGKQVFISKWQNDKIDTLRIYYDFDLPPNRQENASAGGNRMRYSNSDKIEYLILANECREIVLVNIKTSDTLTLRRKQYFYQ